MSVSYPLTLPSVRFVRTTVSMVDAVAVSASPFDYSEETQLYDGQRWSAEIEIARMARAEAGAWRGFLAQCRGQYGSFLLGDSSGTAPLGTASSSPGTPVVDGAVAARVSVLPVRGAALSQTGWLLAGDFFQLGSGADSRLHMVTAAGDTDGSGDVSLEIWPATRVAYSDGDAVTLTAPKGVFRLASNSRAFEIERATVYSTRLAAVEDMR